MAQIEISFGSIVSYIDFTMLVGAHGTGINVDIRVQLSEANLEASRLQEGA